MYIVCTLTSKLKYCLLRELNPFIVLKVIWDLANDANTTIAKQENIIALTRGQMDTTAFKGIERGQNQKIDGSGNKIHKHMSLYFDQTRTTNHGMQEVHSNEED